MTYIEACKKAYEYFKDESKSNVLTSALENKTHWIFGGGEPDEVEECGGAGIKINKENGRVDAFILPRDLNILREASQISIPEEYKR